MTFGNREGTRASGTYGLASRVLTPEDLVATQAGSTSGHFRHRAANMFCMDA